MKAALYYGPRDVRIEDVPSPGSPKPDEVLLQILAASVCGTDASQYVHPTMIPLAQTHPVSGHCGPVILGHEVVGRILEKGANVEGLEIGDRVVPGCGSWCGACTSCRAGHMNICERYYLYGIHCNGGLAEQAIFPAKMCILVPPACSDRAAALAQPTAVALHILSRIIHAIGPLEGQRLALFGAGNIGSLLLAVLQSQHIIASQLIVIDIESSRLATARSLGASHCINGREQMAEAAVLALAQEGVDIAIEATGNPSSIRQALSVVRRGGCLMQVGIPSQSVELHLQRMVVEEKTILSSNGQIALSDLPIALEVLSTTDLAARIGTTTIVLDDFVRDGLLPLVEHRAVGKIVVVIG